MKFSNYLSNTASLVKYNIKIIFANKFIYFLGASVIVFLAFTVGNLLSGGSMQPSDAFNVLMLAGALIIFYPLTFGIQSDKDARTLEIIFGIPNYRYRVWLVRNVMIVIMAFLFVFLLACLIDVVLVNINGLTMAVNVMFPLLFAGMLSFFISTVVKSGNATAVIIITVAIALLLFGDSLDLGYFDIFFNPYDVPSNTNQSTYSVLASKNKAFLFIGSIVLLLGGLFKLQEREKFLG